jgi:hypothetical protein
MDPAQALASLSSSAADEKRVNLLFTSRPKATRPTIFSGQVAGACEGIDGFVSGINAKTISTAVTPTAVALNNPANCPNLSTMIPDIDVLTEAPIPERAPTRPCAKLNRPVPAVRSAMTDAVRTPIVALLSPSPPLAPPSIPLPTEPATAASTPDTAGERRHITVMFCDLVDSTGIAARLDAEEWRDLVGAYLDAASASVAEMGGKVAKKLGDGLMALFGYPMAQENDAERAARAALSIQRALSQLNRKNEAAGKPALAALIAIDTGPAVLDATGEIFGDVPNVAARAQALAEPS